MRKSVPAVLAAGLFTCAGLTAACAQSSPNLSYGKVPTPGQWNNYFASKQDALGFRPLNRAGDTLTGELTIAPSQTTGAGLNVSPGFDPAAPQNGDFWYSSNGFFVRWNGASFNLAGGPVSCSQLPALTGDVTRTAGSCAETVVSSGGNGFGTAAFANTGATGHTLPYLDQANTFGGANTFSGVNTFTQRIIESNTSPTITWNKTDEPTDQKNWDVNVSPGSLNFRAVNDAYSSASTWLQVTRTAATVTGITFGAPTTFNGNVSVNGNESATGSMTAANGLFSNNGITASVGNFKSIDGSGYVSFDAMAGLTTHFSRFSRNNGVTYFFDDIANANILGFDLNGGYSYKNFTVYGELILSASTAAGAKLNLPHGVTPTTLYNGDIWTTSAGLYAYINGSIVGPFVSATSGGKVLLNTLTASGSGATLQDTSSFTASYSEYEIVFENVVPATNGTTCNLTVQSGGAFQTTSYNAALFSYNNGGTGGNGIATGIPCGTNISNVATAGISGTFRVSRVAGTAMRKQFYGTFNSKDSTATYGAMYMAGGFWDGGSGAITGIQVSFASGNIASGVIKIYGYN